MRKRSQWTHWFYFFVLTSTGCNGGSGISPEVVELYAPFYPDFMFMTGKEAEVLVEAAVNWSGDVVDARLQEPLADEDEWFMAYWKDHETFVRQWRFKPSQKTQRVLVRFRYELLPEDADIYDLGTSFIAPSTVVIRASRLPEKIYSDPIVEIQRETKEP